MLTLASQTVKVIVNNSLSFLSHSPASQPPPVAEQMRAASHSCDHMRF